MSRIRVPNMTMVLTVTHIIMRYVFYAMFQV